MKLSILQMNIKLGRFETNLDTLYRMLSDAMEKRPDAILLPELWDIGFYPKPVADYADPDGARVRKILSGLAAKYQINIIGGSIANRIGQHVFIVSVYPIEILKRILACIWLVAPMTAKVPLG